MESSHNEVLSYLPLLVLIGVSTLVAVAMIGISAIVGPKKPNVYKSTSYECGMTPIGSARERFPIKFYLIAMLFIIFDIETIFLYPWAVTFRDQAYGMKVFYFAEMIVFVVILFVGYFYILGKGALDWDESERAVSQDTFTPEIRAARAPIRFGNESSGPVRQIPTGERAPSYGASSQEEGIS